ncbi:protein PALS2-like [Ostrea edulis]|uniref:protein PALS2-like n=1 Tax=Ostrea edulis TaxID=37623 RepID=UPI002094650B|nr:protein PALS2-like [Ostrea edulis]
MELDASPGNHGVTQRERCIIKRRVNREHHSNFNAGYINIDEQYLHRTGIRGRKVYILYCLIFILVVLALLNILMTAGILYMLRLTPAGMEMLEFIPNNNLLRFLADTTLPSVKVFQGGVGSRHASSLQIDSGQQIILNASSSKIKDVEGGLEPKKIQFHSVDEFGVLDRETKATLFSSKFQTWTNVQNPGLNLHVPSLSTGHIQSKAGVDRLVMEANSMYLTGMEGFDMLSQDKHIHINTGHSLLIQSKVGNINIEASNHVFISKDIQNSSQFSPNSSILVYKVCVCMPSVSIHKLKSNLGEIGDILEADQDDLDFLKKFLNNPALKNILQVKDKLEDENPLEPVTEESAGKLATDAVNVLGPSLDDNEQAQELEDILSNPHLGALLRAHDDVADRNYGDEVEEESQLFSPPPPLSMFSNMPDQVRLVGIRREKNAPLGITVKIDERAELVIARILSGSMIDKQGLLHVGDIIKEVNGIPVSTPEQLMDIIRSTDAGITLKIIQNYTEQQPQAQKYVKAHFNYDPQRDRLIPCKDAGLPFKDGDILHIMSTEDPNWWQAKIVTEDVDGPTGLIPAQQLEEKRQAYVQPDYDYSKSSLFCGLKKRKKRTIKYSTRNHKDFDNCNITIYEEVTRMPPFQRKTLVLVGANHVGRRSMKERLIRDDPRRFGAVMPHTSREPRKGEEHGKGYFFDTRENMEADIKEGKFLEFGEFNGNLYGTKLESIHYTVQQGKMCVLDVNPTSLKVLKNAEYMPYIVFLAAPSATVQGLMWEEGRRRGKAGKQGGQVEMRTERDFLIAVEESAQIERVYKQYFDLTVVNDDFEETYRELKKALTDLSAATQWVPVDWVY